MSGSEVVFFLTTLHSAQLRDQYEQWVRDVDTPASNALPGITSYRVVRLEQAVMADAAVPSYSYIEIIEVSDLATYQASLGQIPSSFFDEFRTYISGFDAVAGRYVN